MTEKYRENDNRERAPQDGALDRISAVVQLKRGTPVYLGWDINGSPIATEDQNQLSENAKKNVNEYRQARLPIKRVNFSNIDVVSFGYVGQAVDYVDQDGVIAEDILTYGVVDNNGKSQTISISESSALDAIVNSRNVWQQTTTQVIGLPISTANKIYTLFISGNDDESTGMAVLFRPTLKDGSNETAFKIFLSQTLNNLLNIERAQKNPNLRKGYLRALEGYSEKNKSSVLAKFVQVFLTVSDEDVANFTEGILRAAEKLKIVRRAEEENDNFIAFDSGIDNLDIDTLFDLAAEMKRAADRTFR